MSRPPLALPQNFAKRFEDEDQLVSKLVSRGLTFADEQNLRHILRTVGYYRLTGYLYPFRKTGSDDYVTGTSLAKIWEIYTFDRRLRLVVMDALARIEVALRTAVMNHHSAFTGGTPFAYCDLQMMSGFTPQAFADFEEAMDKAIRQAERSNNPAVMHHVAQFGHSKVPVWVLMENLSLGDAGRYYQGLPPIVQQKVANEFGIWPSAFRGWLNVLRLMRNICAHQGRLWNRKIASAISYNFTNSIAHVDLYACVAPNAALNHTTVFTALSLCAWMLRQIRPQSLWRDRIKALVAAYPTVLTADMGFPSNWVTLALWR